MATTEPLVERELRITCSVLGEGDASHIALFATDASGQWLLVTDASCESEPEHLGLSGDIAALVRSWLEMSGAYLQPF